MNNITVQHFIDATQDNNRVVIDNTSATPTISQAKYSFKDQILSLIANIPLLKDLGYIKAHVSKIHVQNQIALHFFVDILSKQFGQKAAATAFEMFNLSNINPVLDKYTIQKLTATAEGICGTEGKNLACHFVVRHFPGGGFDINDSLSNPNHSAITIVNSLGKANVKVHVSLYADGMSYLRTGKGIFRHNYQEDRYKRMTNKTATQLEQGRTAQDKLNRIKKGGMANLSEEEINQLERQAKFLPRGTQRRDKYGEWGVGSLNVYIPSIGMNRVMTNKKKKVGEEKFILFGLNENNMIKAAQKAKSGNGTGKIGYKMISKTDNCAAMTARMLIAGGASIFMPFSAAWISEDPNKIYNYARDVQKEIARLNQTADKVIAYCENLHFDLDVAIGGNDISYIDQKMDGYIANFQHTLYTTTPNDEDDLNSLIYKAKNLVQEMDQLIDEDSSIDGIKDNRINKILLNAQKQLTNIQSRMEKLIQMN